MENVVMPEYPETLRTVSNVYYYSPDAPVQ